LTVVILLAAALLSACGGSNSLLTESQALVANGQLTPVAPRQVAGSIAITGSSTVYPLTLRMAREFRLAGSRADVNVGEVGTGGGFRAFCAGAPVDIVDASRPITEQEQADCRAKGREPVAFQIGIDALSVMVSSDNPFAQALNFAQLKQIFTGQARRWSEVDPSFPDQPIAIFSPGKDSGTFDFFVGSVLGGDSKDLLALPGAVFSEDDEVLRQGIVNNPYAIGYFGYAYYRTSRGRLRALSLDAGKGPVAPGFATATTGSYPLSRPLFLYSSANILREKPAAAAFISYYLAYVDLQIDDVGYFPVPDATIAQSQAALVDVLQ
jgi:phosphate binding protein